jgi:phage tail P2-like protein
MDLCNVSILSLMPPNLAKDRNVKMMAEAFDETLRDIIKKIPDIGIIPNLVLENLVNETLIDILAFQFHVDFYDPKMPIEVKRKLVLKSLDWHTRKGTPSVVEEIVTAVFSDAVIEERYEYGGLPYRFRISTGLPLSDGEIIKNLMDAIFSVKNTRSWLDVIDALINYEFYVGSFPDFSTHINILSEENDSVAYIGVMPMYECWVDIYSMEEGQNG